MNKKIVLIYVIIIVSIILIASTIAILILILNNSRDDTDSAGKYQKNSSEYLLTPADLKGWDCRPLSWNDYTPKGSKSHAEIELQENKTMITLHIVVFKDEKSCQDFYNQEISAYAKNYPNKVNITVMGDQSILLEDEFSNGKLITCRIHFQTTISNVIIETDGIVTISTNSTSPTLSLSDLADILSPIIEISELQLDKIKEKG